MSANDSFSNLNPELVLSATEAAGFHPTGEFTQLNSYENRVFDIRLEDTHMPRVIVKFYRPGRWSRDCILEEHEFLSDLHKEGLKAVGPLAQRGDATLTQHEGMFFALFPKVLGKMPEEFLGDDLKQVGRSLARLHNVGTQQRFKHRPIMGETPATSWQTLEFLSGWVAPEVWNRYETAAIDIIEAFEDQVNPSEFIRIHGDCHRGNLLFNKEFYFVDFDDCMMGPVAQDFWMLFSSSDDKEEQELILSGYEELREFPKHQWEWMPLLRAHRIISYAAWIAKRWQDPSFPRLFPDFNSYSYWAEEVESLEKIARSI
jgi:Ser/Thr protein kinase RdoA (MazF antagonist)